MEAGISQVRLTSVLSGWIECGFLKKASIWEDKYGLGDSYFQLTDFLQDQGALREEGSKAAKKFRNKHSFCENMR